ncbi:MAG: MotA/TolQ/ExbB proton channel family protein [Chthoniobacteraceae bacterium]
MIVAFSIFRFIVHGGFFMYLLLICSVVSLATMFLRGWALRRENVIPSWLWNRIEALQPGESGLENLRKTLAGDLSPLARITEVALQHLEWPRSENMEAVQTRARHEVIRMETGLTVLEVIVGIAPLLGLLGAVSGLVTVFGTMGASESITDPRGIAGGIAEALNTTIAGLSIAIPSLIAYSYFSKKVETLSVEMEAIVGELLAKCYSRKHRAKSTAAAASTAQPQETAPNP